MLFLQLICLNIPPYLRQSTAHYYRQSPESTPAHLSQHDHPRPGHLLRLQGGAGPLLPGRGPGGGRGGQVVEAGRAPAQ